MPSIIEYIRDPKHFTLSVLRKLHRFIPDESYLAMVYRLHVGERLQLSSPTTFSQKLQCYKLYYRDPVMHSCVDKWEVRDYVRSKGLEHILNRCYGVYSSVGDIDFDSLPQAFVAKTTHGGGGAEVALVRDKSQCDIARLKSELAQWQMRDIYDYGLEWAYKGLPKRIIVEELLTDDASSDGSVEDYKFMCFGGKFRYFWVDKDRYTHHKRGFWDWNLQFLEGVSSDCDTFATPPPLPGNLPEMIAIAEVLASDFPFARIDLYNISGRIVFGEITFYPWNGFVRFTPPDFNRELGSHFPAHAITKH